jgi:N-methylhydantoinase B
MGNRVGMRKKDGTLTLYNSGKVNMRLDAGEAYVLHSGGGGGFGDPKKRDKAAVLRDLRLGYISEETARKVYGLKVATSQGARQKSRRAP